MNALSVILAYALTFFVFLVFDLLWLGILAKNLYKKYLGGFLSDQVNRTAAAAFYLVFVLGISIFAIYPAVATESVGRTILFGALFGFFTYATYDLTNLATLKGWPLKIVVIDILWGTVLSGIVGFAGYHIVLLLK